MPKAKRQRTSTAGKELKMLLHQPVLLLMILLILATLGIFVLYPMFRVVELSFTDGENAFTLSNLMYVLGSRSYRAVFTNSLKLAAITAFFATLVGYLFAYACTRTKMPGRRFFNTLIHLPIISPPFILALSIIFLFGRQGIITKGLFGIKNNNVYGFGSLVLIQVISFFPVAYLTLTGIHIVALQQLRMRPLSHNTSVLHYNNLIAESAAGHSMRHNNYAAIFCHLIQICIHMHLRNRIHR